VVSAEINLERAREVLGAWALGEIDVEMVSIGLINRTFLVTRNTDGTKYIFQYVNPIFTPQVHDDIEAVTAHVMRAEKPELLMPRLVRTEAGALYQEDQGQIFRVLSYIEGDTFEKLSSPAVAEEAGRLLARFHRAVADLSHEFKNKRLGVHDTPKHLAALRTALETHRAHPSYTQVAPFGREILAAAETLPVLPAVADRVVHGDPKISNLLFARGSGQALALVDLDTLARMPIYLELGDAFRSWCNPSGEDQTEVQFSLPLFTAAVRGYAEVGRSFLTEEEKRSFVAATQTIIVELSARFCADVLNESYFGWDPSRFATRGEHNELRARGQFALYRSLTSMSAEAEAIVARAFS
jgi:Ser/Thr protein kinase RdoA (MazF antagonist)